MFDFFITVLLWRFYLDRCAPVGKDSLSVGLSRLMILHFFLFHGGFFIFYVFRIFGSHGILALKKSIREERLVS